MTDEINLIRKIRTYGWKVKKVVLQNQRRYELYKEGFERIERGLKEERYFEVVCISVTVSSTTE